MSAKYILIVIIAAIAIAAGGLFLLPDNQEIALMQMKDKRFEEATKTYESQLEQNKLTLEVTKHLSDLYLKNGDVAKATKIMESFVAANPTHLEARQQLSVLYRYANRQNDHKNNLEIISKIDSDSETTETLTQLSQIYNANGEYKKQAETLRKIITKEQGKNSRRFIDLANVLAAGKFYKAAISTLREFQRLHPEHYEFSEALLLITFLLEDKNQKDALKEARAWIYAHNDHDDAAKIASILHFKGEPKLALTFLSKIPDDEINSSESLLEQYILAKIALAENHDVYLRLKKLSDEKKLPKSFAKNFLMTAISDGELENVKNIFANIEPDVFSEDELLLLIERAYIRKIKQNDPSFLTLLSKRFSASDIRNKFPILELALHAVNSDSDDINESNHYKISEINNTQSMQVARLCKQAGKKNCALYFLEKINNNQKNYNNLSIKEITDISQIYFDLGAFEQGEKFLAKIMLKRSFQENSSQENSDQEIEKLLMNYAAAQGNNEMLALWLETDNNSIQQSELNDLLFIANNHQQFKTARIIAEVMQRRYDSPMSRSLLTVSYLKLGLYENAIELLRANISNSIEDEHNYLAVLAEASIKNNSASKDYNEEDNEKYRKELMNYATSKFAQDISEETRLSLVYTLINANLADTALPEIAKLAEEKGGNWANIYAAHLDKSGKHQEARKFWLKIANNPETSADEKRAIGFSLLNKNYYLDAEKIFLALADNAPPDSQDVQSLLYIWGPQLNAQQIIWLKNRYYSSGKSFSALNKEQQSWLELLANYAADDVILKLADENPAILENSLISARYINAIINNGSFVALAESEINNASLQKNTEILRQYGQLSRQHNFANFAIQAYHSILTIKPDDYEANAELGMIYFEQQEYEKSRKYFETTILQLNSINEIAEENTIEKELSPEPYRVLFNYAELLRYYNDKKQSKIFYEKTIANLNSTENSALPEVKAIAATSAIRLNNSEQGLLLFKEIISNDHGNKALRADYISALLDTRNYQEAENLLLSSFESLENKLEYNKNEESEIILFKNIYADNKISSYQLLENNRKLLLIFSSPLKQTDSYLLENIREFGWINYVSEGYRAILIAAKPSYKIIISANISDKKSLSASAIIEQSQHEIKAEEALKLRYEMLFARYELETGKIYRALQRLNKLLSKNPDNAQLMVMSASAELSGGNQMRALQLAKAAKILSPNNEAINKFHRDLQRQYAPHALLDYERLSSGNNSQNITTFSGYRNFHGGLENNLQLGVITKNNVVDVKSIRRANGRIGNFAENRSQVEVSLSYNLENAQRIRAMIFGNEDKAGLGGYYSFVNEFGETSLSLEWQKPYWEGFDAILDYATRDRLAVSHIIKPDSRWFLSLNGAVNNYDNSFENNVLKTISSKLEIIYILREAFPYIALGYGFDAEYDLNHKKSIDSLGGYTRLFSQSSREVHFFSINAARDFGESWRGDIFAGYALDRFGGSSPSCSGRLTYAVNEQIDLQLRALYGLDRSNSSEATTRFGINLRWRYDNDL